MLSDRHSNTNDVINDVSENDTISSSCIVLTTKTTFSDLDHPYFPSIACMCP